MINSPFNSLTRKKYAGKRIRTFYTLGDTLRRSKLTDSNVPFE